ncbi:MAG: HAD family phosphatase [Clostridia bacterium]|nr:HAD family phosphatase [Clostridia bacterium]
MVRAALFDMDGLLLDSERVYAEAVLAVAPSLGYHIPRDLILECVGITAEATDIRYAQENPGFDSKVLRTAMTAWLKERGYDLMIPAKPYAKQILPHLKEHGFRCALVTSSSLPNVRQHMKAVDLFRYFDAVVTGDLGLASKPSPEVYLRAIELLGIPAADCAVIEDSHNGIRAGHAAGAMTIMVPDLVPYSDALASVCDHVCRDLQEVEDILLCR